MSPTLLLDSPTSQATREIGEAIGALLEQADVVSLTGDLGAGKTTFVQGAARALGVSEPVLSPTFTLVREYHGTLPVHHIDVYRLDRLQDVLDIGFDEMLEGGSVLFIEWGDAIESLLPEAHLQVQLEVPGLEDVRRLTLTPSGRPWAERWGPLQGAVAPWRAGRLADVAMDDRPEPGRSPGEPEPGQ